MLAVLALPWFEEFLRDVDPTLRPLVVLTGLLLAVGLGETARARPSGDGWRRPSGPAS